MKAQNSSNVMNIFFFKYENVTVNFLLGQTKLLD